MGRGMPSGERQNSKKSMDNRQLFATALGLADPWYVESVELAPQELGGPDVLQKGSHVPLFYRWLLALLPGA